MEVSQVAELVAIFAYTFGYLNPSNRDADMALLGSDFYSAIHARMMTHIQWIVNNNFNLRRACAYWVASHRSRVVRRHSPHTLPVGNASGRF